MIKHFWKTSNFTRKSEITLHDHFTQPIYVVGHSYSLYPLFTLANNETMCTDFSWIDAQDVICSVVHGKVKQES